eukprot:TRINITY_DN635_c0_g1_i2.p1 TRINITY_DN635_c0_g1~~TRINITY_DN635_c0_g1_i2.p1  ORF type:complete len:501 (-),score=45.93 TRINITY_DN635_c0_g1_i2:129-1568(-)
MAMPAVALHEKSPFFLDSNRPFLQRHDTMSLDIVRPKDIPRGKIMYPKDEDRSLMTHDIKTAQPTYPHLNYLNKPDLCVGSTDPTHVGAKARTYYPAMDRKVRDLSLTTADIEYAQPKSNKQKGNRHTDPVCPNYALPTCYKREPTPPRHNGRITNDISDIELSCPKKLIPDRNYVRDPNESRDIEYASANYHERMAAKASRGPRQDRQYDVRDITGTKRIQPRQSNPLDPEYTVPTHATTSLHAVYTEETGQQLAPRDAHMIGQIHGSKPRKLQWDNGEPHFSLLREDIAGTVPQRWIGSVPANIYDPPEVRPAISFHDPHDIPGAQVGSLKKGIEGSTRRQVNPLNPRYPMLDGDTRPQPVPLMEGERGHPCGGLGSHPMLQSRMLPSSSAPDLRTPSAGSRAGERVLHRDASQPTMHMMPGSRRSSRAPSGYATPVYQRSGAGIGDTIRMEDPPMSRRSSHGGSQFGGSQALVSGR